MSGGGQSSGGYGGGYGGGQQSFGGGGITGGNMAWNNSQDPNSGYKPQYQQPQWGAPQQAAWGGANPVNNPGVSPGHIPGGGFGVNPDNNVDSAPPAYQGRLPGGGFGVNPGDTGTDQAQVGWAIDPNGSANRGRELWAKQQNTRFPPIGDPAMIGPPSINPGANPMQGRGPALQQPTGFEDWRARRSRLGI